MYATSEEALDDTSPISMARAIAEIARHGFMTRSSPTMGKIEVFEGATDRDGADASCWVEIDRTPRAILEWLGY